MLENRMAVDLSEGTHGGPGSVFIRGAAAQVYACVKCNAGALSHVSIPPLRVTRMSSVNKNCCFCHSLSSSTHWPEDGGRAPKSSDIWGSEKSTVALGHPHVALLSQPTSRHSYLPVSSSDRLYLLSSSREGRISAGPRKAGRKPERTS